MWNEPTQRELNRLPNLYSTENVPLEDKLIQMHFFFGGCDWYVAEYGPPDRTFFGYAILNQDFDNAEWGYVNFDELRNLNIRGIEVDRDLYWKVRPAKDVDNIRKSGGCD